MVELKQIPHGDGRGNKGMPSLGPFLSGKAIKNRSQFLLALNELRELSTRRSDGVHDITYLSKLQELVSKLNKPSLRLELLQYVLGLDQRYTKPVLLETATLALKCVQASPPTVSRSAAPSSTSAMVTRQDRAARRVILGVILLLVGMLASETVMWANRG